MNFELSRETPTPLPRFVRPSHAAVEPLQAIGQGVAQYSSLQIHDNLVFHHPEFQSEYVVLITVVLLPFDLLGTAVDFSQSPNVCHGMRLDRVLSQL